ncbi:MAG: tyrosine--tRNA ligase [Myxococcota bacterium]|nr:tyrosine--tRNA ligase [Myxococcota bacterium]
MNAFDVLKSRGFVKQVTHEDQVRDLFENQKVVAYTGYDPTATSLHVGHLFTLMALKHIEALGHQPIVVIGGGTAQVGDPSGKTEMRKMLEVDTIGNQIETIKSQISGLLDFDSGKSLLVNNADWLCELNYIDFLREIGQHFSVNRMLSAEAYKIRLEKGLSFLEFNYQILQAYDFWQLHQRHGCILQMGGDDQWGNILAGVDLCRRLGQTQVHGLTFPLQMNAHGEKMGKTAKGAVWLNAQLLSPFDYYQYWVNTHDDDVHAMLGFFTFLPMDEINAVAHNDAETLNAAKSILAFEATKIVHGEPEAKSALQAAQSAFGQRHIPETLLPSSNMPRKIETADTHIPSLILNKKDIEENSLRLFDVLVQAEFAQSKSSAKRLIKQGAVRLNGDKISDEFALIQMGSFEQGQCIMKSGKKHICRLTIGA